MSNAILLDMKVAEKIQTEREKIVSVRMTPEEHRHLSLAAQRVGMRLSSFLRLIALEKFPLQIQADVVKDEKEISH